MNTKIHPGFTYLVEVVKDGVVVDSEVVHNLMPTEGLNYMLSTAIKGTAGLSPWYIGLYEGNYTPVGTDTAAGFPAAATETTAYTEATRVEFNEGTVAAGAADNSANRAEFTFNAAKTVYGGFISSASAKGGVSGVLLSAVRFSSPKVLEIGAVLRVTAGFTLASA
jgi:hypothetical protein